MKKISVALVYLLYSTLAFADGVYSYVSPTNTGINDALIIPLKIQDKRFVAEWKVEISDESGEVVHIIRNKEKRIETSTVQGFFKKLFAPKTGVDVPETVRWNCIYDNGRKAPDGVYFFRIHAKDDNDNETSTEKYKFVIDSRAPEIEISVPAKFRLEHSEDIIFAPGSEGEKSLLEVSQKGSKEVLWEGEFTDVYGRVVRKYQWKDMEPEGKILWDGEDDAGNMVSDGVYTYTVRATDRAGNSSSAQLRNIIIDTEKPVASISIAYGAFSPTGNSERKILPIYLSLTSQNSLMSWELRILDFRGKQVRSYKRDLANPKAPAQINFDGKGDGGELLPDGVYYGEFTSLFKNGVAPKVSSPKFVVKTTIPAVELDLKNSVFSPDGDGKLDELNIGQTFVGEASWTGRVYNGNSEVVKTFEFGENPTTDLVWDGLCDNFTLVEDGVYIYEIKGEDVAGNHVSARTSGFTVDTSAMEIFLTSNRIGFSPVKDENLMSKLPENAVVKLFPQVKSSSPLASYELLIIDSRGNPVKKFSGENYLPAEFVWDGSDDEGFIVADGTFSALLETVGRNGNHSVAGLPTIICKSIKPEITASSQWKIFDPTGTKRPTLPITVESSVEKKWTAQVLDSENNVVKTFRWENSAMPNFSWDGTDDAGNVAANGTYSVLMTTEDIAGNIAEAVVEDITLDTRRPKLFVTNAYERISASATDERNKQRIHINLSDSSPRESWNFSVYNSAGKPVYSVDSEKYGDLPEVFEWDGHDSAGELVQGEFYAGINIAFQKGDEISGEGVNFTVWNTPPDVSVKTKPRFFSPDNDGVEDDLFIDFAVKTKLPVKEWTFSIKDPQNGNLFYRQTGASTVPAGLVWDGKGLNGELVESATDYPFEFVVTDDMGMVGRYEGIVAVDILVLRHGDVLKIRVPGIIFADRRADFVGLDKLTLERNNFVLRRIAASLNKFDGYKITIEGHANKVDRTAEEAEFNLTLSSERAASIKNMLSKMGVSAERISTVGKGDTEPIVSFEDKPNWWKNRRVEFILQK